MFLCSIYWSFPDGSDGKGSACNASDPGLIPGSGRSPEKDTATTPVFLPRKPHGQRAAWLGGYSHGVTKSLTQLNEYLLKI